MATANSLLPEHWAIIAAVAVLITTAVLFRRRVSESKNGWLKELRLSKAVHPYSSDLGPLKDISEEPSRSGSESTSTGGRPKQCDRPFGSSYYYAHNSSSAKGGYTDGLRMEDYTMNQPRLLSKAGVPVSGETRTASSATNEGQANPREAHTTSQSSKPVLPKNSSRWITKYSWDDPGDPNGIATIRIDTLPTERDGTRLWQEMQEEIVDIDARLINGKKGLLVLVECRNGDKYQLHLPLLYGDVEAVKAVSKPKRLLVRLYKRKNRINVFDKKNLKEWPHPFASRGKQA